MNVCKRSLEPRAQHSELTRDAAEGCGLEDGMRERRGGLDDGAIDRRKENNGI